MQKIIKLSAKKKNQKELSNYQIRQLKRWDQLKNEILFRLFVNYHLTGDIEIIELIKRI